MSLYLRMCDSLCMCVFLGGGSIPVQQSFCTSLEHDPNTIRPLRFPVRSNEILNMYVCLMITGEQERIIKIKQRADALYVYVCVRE